MTDPLITENPYVKAVVSALFGAFISKRFRRGMTTGEWIVALASVTGMALIFVLPLVEYFGGNLATVLVVGCLVGAFGIPIFESALDAVKKGIITDFLKSRF